MLPISNVFIEFYFSFISYDFKKATVSGLENTIESLGGKQQQPIAVLIKI